MVGRAFAVFHDLSVIRRDRGTMRREDGRIGLYLRLAKALRCYLGDLMLRLPEQFDLGLAELSGC